VEYRVLVEEGRDTKQGIPSNLHCRVPTGQSHEGPKQPVSPIADKSCPGAAELVSRGLNVVSPLWDLHHNPKSTPIRNEEAAMEWVRDLFCLRAKTIKELILWLKPSYLGG
jgi:hypothetical protein